MPRLLKIVSVISGILIGLILLAWIGVASYVSTHKKQLLATITSQLNENLKGKLTIESMEPTLLRGFPGISVSLKNVLLRDSLFNRHKHTLLQAKNLYVQVNSLSLITGNPRIQRISMNNGSIYVYTDSAGYTNSSLFTADPKSKKKNATERKINNIDFSNVRFVYDNQLKGKLFDLYIKHLDSRFRYKHLKWNAEVDMSVKVQSLTFNLSRGSFIKNKQVVTDLSMSYDQKEHFLNIPLQNIEVGNEKLKIAGDFSFADQNPNFKLSIKAPSIYFKNAYSFLLPKVISKMKAYSIERPLTAEATIWGKLKGKNIPLVKASWKTENNTISFLGETIKNCSFSGFFTNEVVKGRSRTDPNSSINFRNFKGQWSGINFSATAINITNLLRPVFQGSFQSSFPLTRINALSGSETFAIKGGSARLDLLYRAPFNSKTPVEPYVFGSISIKNSSFNYRPRNITFRNVSGLVKFKQQDVFFQNMRVDAGTTALVLDGTIKNFVNLYYADPKKMLFDWKARASNLNLVEFLAFLGKRRSYASTTKSKNKLFKQLDLVLNEANVHLSLNANRLVYKNFAATRVNSNIKLQESGIVLQNVSLNHAGGRLLLKGNIDQSGYINTFNVDTKISHVNIETLFYAFDNFGQDAITSQNIKGIFSSATKVRGSMKDNGQIVPGSFHGTVSFNLQNGSLINFEPMQKIGNLAFHNRDFSNITFSNLKNTLTVQGNKIIIPEMVIRSSVLNLFVKGVYGIPTGTNIALEVPIRNPEKDKELPDSLKNERIRKGIVINLTAVDGEDGSVKIKLGKRDNEEDDKKKEKPAEKEKAQAEKKKEDEVKPKARRSLL